MKIAIFIESEREVAQSCPTLCDPIDCSPPGSSTHEILQARILEWVAISFSLCIFQNMFWFFSLHSHNEKTLEIF